MSGQGDEGLLWSLGSGGLEPRHLFIMQTESLPTLDWPQNNSNVPQQEDNNKMILYKNIIFLNPKYFVMLGEVWNVSVETVRDEWCVDSLYGMGWHQNHAGDCSVPHLMNVPRCLLILNKEFHTEHSRLFWSHLSVKWYHLPGNIQAPFLRITPFLTSWCHGHSQHLVSETRSSECKSYFSLARVKTR